MTPTDEMVDAAIQTLSVCDRAKVSVDFAVRAALTAALAAGGADAPAVPPDAKSLGILNGWLVECVTGCTCGMEGSNPHEAYCGTSPLVDLSKVADYDTPTAAPAVDKDIPLRSLGVDVTTCSQCAWTHQGDSMRAWREHSAAEHPAYYADLLAVMNALDPATYGSSDYRYESARFRTAGRILSALRSSTEAPAVDETALYQRLVEELDRTGLASFVRKPWLGQPVVDPHHVVNVLWPLITAALRSSTASGATEPAPSAEYEYGVHCTLHDWWLALGSRERAEDDLDEPCDEIVRRVPAGPWEPVDTAPAVPTTHDEGDKR